jgi:hypothetical protein
MVTSYLSETTERGGIYSCLGFHRCQSSLQTLCEWCIFPSLWTCSLFNCSFSVALCPYVQYISGHEIAILNSPFRRVSVPQASVLAKHLVNDAPLTLGELIVLFFPLISLAHLHACVQNDKVSSHSNSQTHSVITQACGASIRSS